MTISPGHAATPAAPSTSQAEALTRSPDQRSAETEAGTPRPADRLHPAPACQTSRSGDQREARPAARAARPRSGCPAPIVVPASRSASTISTAAPREDERRRTRPRRAATIAAAGARPLRDERAGGEREQLAVARGDRGAEEPDPEREVLNDGAGGGDADAEQPAGGNLERAGARPSPACASAATDSRSRRQAINDWRSLRPSCTFDRRAGVDVVSPLFAEFVARLRVARSKMSGGTISPRIVFGQRVRLRRATRGRRPSSPSTPRFIKSATASLILLRHVGLQAFLHAAGSLEQLRPIGGRDGRSTPSSW